MDRAAHIASLRREASDLLAAAAPGLTRDVPTCPGWTVERLVGHVGRVYRWTAGWVVAGQGAHDLERAPSGAAVLDWTRAGCDTLIDALRDQAPGIWPRRMAIETAVHRWDVQAAVGDPVAIDPALAVSGIDELFDVLAPWRGLGELAGSGETIHVHATDVTGEWLVELAELGLVVDRRHAKGDVAVRGSASDLLLTFHNRLAPDRVEVFGDAGLLDRWRAVMRF